VKKLLSSFAPPSFASQWDGLETIAVYQVQQHGAGVIFPNSIANLESFICEPSMAKEVLWSFNMALKKSMSGVG